MKDVNRIRLFTWHIHGTYLFYLSQANIDIYIPVDDKRSTGYVGRGNTFPFGANVKEVDAQDVRDLEFDCILFQTHKNYLVDQYEVLTDRQRKLPRIFLEHDPPQEIPTNTRHVVDDPGVTLVHVTHFNHLMWDNGRSTTRVIEHGVLQPTVDYEGTIPKGIVVINNLNERGRRLGLDVFMEVRKYIPLDLIGMDTRKIGGLGEILHPQLPEFISRYRFFFNPIRYTSLGLAVIEAMMIGMPVVGLATTEMVTVIRDGVSGVLHTSVPYLITRMKHLIERPDYARQLGTAGRDEVIRRFNIRRFTDEWESLLRETIDGGRDNKIEKSEILFYET